ncbi:MAG: apolipoprotein N-acyltransferase [Gammaproteobacteria bacterium]|nr:apolipoprotein N-acyltransferase [Gammaproteobacteria bacterium]MCW8923019.1 apolipoprotein N-acyltransferase [Gammaproteobacteria bacterium]
MLKHAPILNLLKKLSTFFSIEFRFLPLLSLLAGALTALAFAPFNQVWLIYLLTAFLFYVWLQAAPGKALLHGWLFGVGMQFTGVGWIYFSLHYHGGSPTLFALLLIFFLSAYLSIYTALAGYCVNRFCVAGNPIKLLLLYPMAWAFFEWLQGIVLTGFSWQQLGYTQIDWPLSGFAPLIGSHGVGLLLAMTSGALVLLLIDPGWRKKSLLLLSGVWLAGLLLKQIAWTEVAGDEIRVALIQGNIEQSLKWKRESKIPTLQRYKQLSLDQEDVDLIIWPETSIPGFQHQLSGYIAGLAKAMQEKQTDLLAGIFIKDPATGRYYNSLINVNGGEYRKRHLVPLGEYVPLRSLIEFFNRFMKIPMSDIASGDYDQPLLRAAGQPLGVSVCFEDAFARDVRKDLPEASLLVNVSNDAWFDGSHEPFQHHAIARMRALESGRYMLRATNTGISSVIGPKGEEIALSPQFETYVLKAGVWPMQGATPYILWGDWLLVLGCLGVLGSFILKARCSS